jgi:hypothetical protein
MTTPTPDVPAAVPLHPPAPPVPPTPSVPQSAARIAESSFDRLLSVHRPVVLAHLRTIRASKPNASPAQVQRILDMRYLTAITSGGALVGASAALPAVGLGASLALSAAETAGFLETSALYAQSVTELHGIAVDDPDRARALVMSLILGKAGGDLVRQLAGQAAGQPASRNDFWGELITKSLPQVMMDPIADQLRKTFIKKFGTSQATSVLGRAIPFGIGAVVGGVGNNILARRVVRGAHEAFGAPPASFPDALAPIVRVPRAERKALKALPKQLP